MATGPPPVPARLLLWLKNLSLPLMLMPHGSITRVGSYMSTYPPSIGRGLWVGMLPVIMPPTLWLICLPLGTRGVWIWAIPFVNLSGILCPRGIFIPVHVECTAQQPVCTGVFCGCEPCAKHAADGAG